MRSDQEKPVSSSHPGLGRRELLAYSAAFGTSILAAEALGKSVAQLVINWTIHQPGICAALCGAKRAYQIEETAGAMGWTLDENSIERIDAALAQRGRPVSTGAV